MYYKDNIQINELFLWIWKFLQNFLRWILLWKAYIVSFDENDKVWAFVKCHINLLGLFNAKVIFLEELQLYNLTHSRRNNGLQAFPKVICLKANVISWPEFEFAYYDTAVLLVSHYTTLIPLKILSVDKCPIEIQICFLHQSRQWVLSPVFYEYNTETNQFLKIRFN